jgi:hypothetical protein
MRIMSRRSLRKQRGAAGLIGLLVALGLAGAAVGGYALMLQRQYRITYAEIEGQALSQFAVGLRGYVASIQANPALLTSSPVTQTGVNWLKAPTCGGIATNPPEGFVPCNFTGQTLGNTYSTTITRDAFTNNMEARLAVRVALLDGDPRGQTLTAERVVESALRQQSLPANGMFYEAFANVPLNATAPGPVVPAPADVGRVLVVVNNAPSNDIFLRTDGTNQMRGNLNFGGFSVRNARDGRFSGDMRVEGRAQIDNDLIVTQGVADLRGGAIVGSSTVDNSGLFLDSIQRFAETGIYQAEVLTGSQIYTISVPDCSRSGGGGVPGGSPAIYTSIQSTGSINYDGTYRADAMYDARVDVERIGSTWWIRPVVRGTRFQLTQTGGIITLDRSLQQVNPADMRIVALVRCR